MEGKPKAAPKPTSTSTSTNALLLLTIFNHASWSTLHVASRYLQVYAKPLAFDGQGVLSSAKGFAALFLFFISVVNSWVEGVRASAGCAGRNGYANIDSNVQQQQQHDVTPPRASASRSLSQSNPPQITQIIIDPNEETGGVDSFSALRRKRVIYTLLFAFVSTTRASSNIASSKYTYSYNITLISSLTPIIIAIFDRFLLHSPFPPLLWPTILLSSLGGFLIAFSQSSIADSQSTTISPKDNLAGCSLQLLSAIFSAMARILMKRTEHILTPTHMVQINNISNCLFPFIYTTIYNPSSWTAFRYLALNPKSLLAWCTISIGVYSLASTLQIRLVRRLGPGFYSSWVAVRVLGSMVLSTFVLGEGIHGRLEWAGMGLMIATISVYVVDTRRWMDGRKEEQYTAQREDGKGCGDNEEEDGDGGEEELVRVPGGEGRALLASDGT